MPTLSYGLNIPSKIKGGTQRPPSAKSKALFGDDSEPEEEDDGGLQAIGSLDEPVRQANKAEPKTGKPEKKKQLDVRFGDLSASHSAAKHAAAAQEVDPTVYDYDNVYDSLHTKPAKKKEAAGPRYMQNLIESAEVRKRDQLRAKEKMLAKEREAEGDEFADKEKFVTAAYRAQQEENKRLEEEERKKEEAAAERRKREGGGLKGLYKDMLAREDVRHEAIAQAMEEKTEGNEEESKDDDELKLAKEIGAVINEDGQVVDKRQLLKAGLNLGSKAKSAPQPATPNSKSPGAGLNALQGRAGVKAGMRERQSRMLESQLEQAAKRAAEDDAAEQAAIQKAAKSQKTEGDISSARERFLQRKREREAEAGKPS